MKLCLLVVLLLNIYYVPTAYCRNITIQLNPGWSNKVKGQKNGDVLYARSQGENDCLHYIWSTVGPSLPTFMLVRSNSTANLHINWSNFLSHFSNKSVEGSVDIVGGNVLESAVHVFNQLIEYNDTNNDVDVKSGTNKTYFDLTRFKWNINVTNKIVLIQGKTTAYPKSFKTNSSIDIKLVPYNLNGRQTQLPRLAYNDLSLGVEVVINNVTSTLKGSRFVINFIAFNPGNSSYHNTPISDDNQVVLVKKATIDDEYCPAVFSTQQMLWQKGGNHNNYWQWRSVCYTSKARSSTSATDIKASQLSFTKTSSSGVLENRILIAYYSEKVLKKVDVMGTNISFGKPDDGYYTATNYLSWTSVIGFGVAPSDSYSLTVIIIIFAGIGCPVIIILLGVVFMLHRKIKQKNVKVTNRYGYEPIG